MDHSPEIGALAESLAKAQGAIRGALKDSANPHFKSKYADLASVWDACRDALSSNGLSVVQSPGETVDGVISLTTMLLHASGQWLKDTLTIPLSKVDAQGYGSAQTYARRYALSAFVGVAPEDDDGNAAVASSQGQGAANNKPSKPEPLKGPIKQRAQVRIACGQFVRDLHSITDSGGLAGFLDANKALMNQVKEECEFFWLGDGADFAGMKAEIDLAKDRIAVAELN